MVTLVMRSKVALTPPPALQPGEIALGLANGAVRMWAGDATGTPVEFGTDANGFVRKTGDTMSGPLVLQAPGNSLQLRGMNDGPQMVAYMSFSEASGARHGWIGYGSTSTSTLTVKNDNASGDIELQFGASAAAPANPSSAMTRGRSDARYLQLTGGALTGFLTLHAKPTQALHPASKNYVDDLLATYYTSAASDARFLPLVGGTLTGALTLPSGNPTSDNHATRKGYVDAQVNGRLTQAQGDVRYAAKVHNHVEADVTDLDRLRYRGAWAAGSYQKNDVVLRRGGVFVAIQPTTTTPPSSHWVSLSVDTANAVVGDLPPTDPLPGALWFRTSDPVGLYVWFTDANSSQWVSVDQAAHGDVRRGSGSPEGLVAAPVGTLYTRLDGGTGTTLYVKETGTGATGWKAK